MTTYIILFGLSLYAFLSMVYVYKFHGNVRFASVDEYIRKGWPIFTPFNCVLYFFTKKFAKKPVLNESDAKEYFDKFSLLKENWEVMREEALQLKKEGYFDAVSNKDSKSYYDIGFRTFYKYGWSKFYLHWYGYSHHSAQRMCPKTVELLEKTPAVRGAMFSILPSGSKLTRHLDPIASSLRYHLALDTPHSEECSINVDGQTLLWKNGEHFVFDETYMHYANNRTEADRIILLCDVERPMGLLGRIFNFLLYAPVLKISVVPNTNEDRRGLINLVFSSLSPVLQSSKNLKEKNIFLYRILKWTVNTSLLIILIALIYGLIQLFL